ncbi:hypothetical protein CRENPOLYSF1_480006 [Crenothrix polyspora]|uniref:Uncharacterized protein n=1 Tax=Crenothrix polyspora TaxID=360316 RepID=A0A1R4HC32_9GAMM|nr:hypothetical protein CRENPOLYSF1_480006 [Crenothrix polyspora]
MGWCCSNPTFIASCVGLRKACNPTYAAAVIEVENGRASTQHYAFSDGKRKIWVLSYLEMI